MWSGSSSRDHLHHHHMVCNKICGRVIHWLAQKVHKSTANKMRCYGFVFFRMDDTDVRLLRLFQKIVCTTSSSALNLTHSSSVAELIGIYLARTPSVSLCMSLFHLTISYQLSSSPPTNWSAAPVVGQQLAGHWHLAPLVVAWLCRRVDYNTLHLSAVDDAM